MVKQERIAFPLDLEFKEKIKNCAFDCRLTMSEFIRLAVQEKIERLEK